MSEQPTSVAGSGNSADDVRNVVAPADLTAILAEHELMSGVTSTKATKHGFVGTFVCRCGHVTTRDDTTYQTLHAAHVAEQITAAGFGLHNSSADVDRITEERDAAVRAVEAERDYWRRQAEGFTNASAANLVRAEQAEAREKALRESVEALAEKWRGQREPFGNELLADLHALLATSPDREGSDQ